MDIRPEVQEACNKLITNKKGFKELKLKIHRDDNGGRLNQTETDALIEALGANTHVFDMRFWGCHKPGPANSAFMDFIANTLIPGHQALKFLMLIGNYVADEVAERMAEELKRSTRVTGLFLASNHLSNNSTRALAEAVSQNSSLTRFGIANNRLGLDGCRMVLSSISAKPNYNQFKELWLGGNNIGVGGSKVIADFIPNAKSLICLQLEANNLGDEGCQIIANALPESCSMKIIHLGNNNISDPGCISLANAVQKNCTIKSVYLKGNRITNNGVAALCETLQHVNFSVQELDLSGNEEVSDEQREQIHHLCNTNLRIKKAFRHLCDEFPKFSLGLCPKALELVETKPDSLFHLIKDRPELFREC